MDVSALTGASGAGGGVDGRVESVQDGKASVKLLGGSSVLVPVDRELPPGTPVTVATASDGTLQLTVRTPDADLARLRDAILNTLRSLVGDSLASALSIPLARGDFAAAARSLPPTSPQASSTSDVPESLPTGPLFLSEPTSPRPPGGTALLAVLSNLGGNAYSAEVAGQPWMLFGPAGVEPSTRLVARAQILPGGGAIWTPDPPADGSGRRGLPERVQAGPAGARELLRWAGAPEASPAEVEDLGKALAAAAKSLSDQVQPEAGVASVETNPSGTVAATPENPSTQASLPVAVAAPSAATGGQVNQVPLRGVPREDISQPSTPRATPPEPAFSKTLLAVPGPASGASLPARAEFETAARSVAEQAAVPTAQAPAGASARTGAVENSNPGPQAAVPIPDPATAASAPSPAQIPSNIAVKVLAAWSLDLPPSEAVRRASLGQAPMDLPAALDSLEKLVQGSPGRHPGLEAALQGLREDGKVPSGTLADTPRRSLEAAVLDALAKESSEGGDPKPLRQAAESLLADRLPDTAPGAESGQTYWSAGPGGGWEKARIVVRDERERKGGKGAPTDFHAVDVVMDPAGMGRVDARLELRGQILTTRLEAADPATADLLRKGLPELSAALARIGLEPGAMEVRSKDPARKALPKRRGAGGALDVRA